MTVGSAAADQGGLLEAGSRKHSRRSVASRIHAEVPSSRGLNQRLYRNDLNTKLHFQQAMNFRAQKPQRLRYRARLFAQQPIDNILSGIDGSCRIAVEGPCQWARRQARVRTGNVRAKQFHPAMRFADFRRPFAALSAKSGSVKRTPKTNSGTRACGCQASTEQDPRHYAMFRLPNPLTSSTPS